MSDPRERFLAAIAERLGAERIVEVHLFSPLRQGPLETGVAVIAVTPPEEAPVAEDAADVARDRLVVNTARYRLTRKGPDRGKWEFEVSATADAPLATVDAVARGVMHRSKDLTETERLSGEQLRTMLQDPLWRTLTS